MDPESSQEPPERRDLSPDDLVRLAKIDAWARVGSKVPMATCVGICALAVYGAIDAISGKVTLFSAQSDLNVAMSGEIPVNLMISVNPAVWALLACSVLLNLFQWAMFRIQRKLNESNIRNLTGSKVQLERVIDEGRTSSGLTPEGRTHPRDQ